MGQRSVLPIPLPPRPIADQAEAERERRAKVIHGEDEFEVSRRLADAVNVVRRNRLPSNSVTCKLWSR